MIQVKSTYLGYGLQAIGLEAIDACGWSWYDRSHRVEVDIEVFTLNLLRE